MVNKKVATLTNNESDNEEKVMAVREVFIIIFVPLREVFFIFFVIVNGSCF